MMDEPRLSAEELACFSELFSPTRVGTALTNDPLVNHVPQSQLKCRKLSLQFSVRQNSLY